MLQEIRFSSLLEQWFHLAPDPIIILNSSGSIIECSKSAQSIYGYSRDELIGKSMMELLSKDSVPTFKKKFPKIQALIPQEAEVKILKKDGTLVDVWCKGVPFTNDYNEFSGALVFQREISQLKELEKRLKIKKVQLETVLANINDGVIYIDKDDKIVFANERGGEFYGFHPDKIVGKDLFELHPKKYHKKVKELTNQVRVKTKYLKTIRHIRGKDVFFELKRLEEDCCYNGIIAIIKDITDELRYLKEKEKVLSQLYQVQKLDVIRHLAGGIAHDINNLLSSVQGNIELFLLKEKPNSNIEYLNNALATIELITELTRQLILFSKQKYENKTLININEILYKLSNTLRASIPKSINLELDLADNLYNIEADSNAIKQCIINLVLNAKDAIKDKGTIKIKTYNVNFSEYRLDLNLNRVKGDFVCLTVEDDGAGIPQNVQEHIFEPFFTTKAMIGTGLGLSVVYGIVKQYRGIIEISSEINNGAKFSLFFPAVLAQDTTINNKTNGESLKGEGESILVIEDEEPIARFLYTVLTEHNYNVTCINTGEEALKLFTSHKEIFDLILVDLVLPDISGVELVDRILNIKPNIKVIFTSGYHLPKEEPSSLIYKQQFEFLTKPYPIVSLLKKVKKVLNKKDDINTRSSDRNYFPF